LLNKQAQIPRLILILALLGLLGSCGFRLRGDIEVPPVLKNVNISGIAEFAELHQELKRVLQRSGSEVTAKREQAKSVINITGEEMKKRVLSVDTQGRAAEYELNYQFSFTVIDNAGTQSENQEQPVANKILVPSQKISLTRDFRFDPNNVLATDAEEKQIRLEMVRFAVRQMMRRIRSSLKYSS
jgi:LPS-assembly lipoprotein